jgi:hypothetical protein
MSAAPLSLTHIPPGSPVWVYALVISALALHIGAGIAAIVSGYVAVSVPKGERLHRRFGTIFFISMLVMAAMGASLAALIQQPNNIGGGLFAFYLVGTAWATAREKDGTVGWVEWGGLFFVLAIAIGFLLWGVQAKMSPHGRLFGYPAPLYFMVAVISGLFAATDVSVIVRGGVFGVQRIARHLWRMCLAFSFAAASFFLGQQKVMPQFIHGSPVLYVLGLLPLGIMIFWLVRVRIGNRFKRSFALSQSQT